MMRSGGDAEDKKSSSTNTSTLRHRADDQRHLNQDDEVIQEKKRDVCVGEDGRIAINASAYTQEESAGTREESVEVEHQTFPRMEEEEMHEEGEEDIADEIPDEPQACYDKQENRHAETTSAQETADDVASIQTEHCASPSATKRHIHDQGHTNNKKRKGGSISLQAKWEEMFQRLVAFREKNGHCLVPNRYSEDPQLGSWVSTQRRQYKILMTGSCETTPMTVERANRLLSIGFVWETKDPRHVPWELRYEELARFVETYGHAQVPIGWEGNIQLANWVSTQRQEYKLRKKGRSSRLSKERIAQLDKLGFIWEAQRGGPRRKKRATVSVPLKATPAKTAQIPVESREPEKRESTAIKSMTPSEIAGLGAPVGSGVARQPAVQAGAVQAGALFGQLASALNHLALRSVPQPQTLDPSLIQRLLLASPQILQNHQWQVLPQGVFQRARNTAPAGNNLDRSLFPIAPQCSPDIAAALAAAAAMISGIPSGLQNSRRDGMARLLEYSKPAARPRAVAPSRANMSGLNWNLGYHQALAGSLSDCENSSEKDPEGREKKRTTRNQNAAQPAKNRQADIGVQRFCAAGDAQIRYADRANTGAGVTENVPGKVKRPDALHSCGVACSAHANRPDSPVSQPHITDERMGHPQTGKAKEHVAERKLGACAHFQGSYQAVRNAERVWKENMQYEPAKSHSAELRNATAKTDAAGGMIAARSDDRRAEQSKNQQGAGFLGIKNHRDDRKRAATQCNSTAAARLPILGLGSNPDIMEQRAQLHFSSSLSDIPAGRGTEDGIFADAEEDNSNVIINPPASASYQRAPHGRLS